jgi:hypothetical protein
LSTQQGKEGLSWASYDTMLKRNQQIGHDLADVNGFAVRVYGFGFAVHQNPPLLG